MAASVWIRWLFVVVSPVVESCVVTVLSRALTIPVVTVCPYPKAFPIAIASLPTDTESESPIVAIFIADIVSLFISDFLTLTTARSSSGSVPLTSAATTSLSQNCTVSCSAFATT